MTYPVLLDVLAPSKRMIEMEGGFLHLTTSGDKIRLSMKVQSFVFFFFFENWTLHCRLRRTKEKTGCYKRGVLLLQPAFSFLFLNWLIEQEKYQITNFLVRLSDLVILAGTWLWWRIWHERSNKHEMSKVIMPLNAEWMGYIHPPWGCNSIIRSSFKTVM